MDGGHPPRRDPAPGRGRARSSRAAHNRRARLLLLALIAAELVAAVLVLAWLARVPGRQSPAHDATPAGGQEPVANVLPSPGNPHPTAVPALWLAELPPALDDAVRDWTAGRSYQLLTGAPAAADVFVSWKKPPHPRPLAQVVLVPTAAFTAGREEVSTSELRRAWRDGSLIVTAAAGAALKVLWGEPEAGAAPAVFAVGELAGRLATDDQAMGIVPFDELQPRLKVLAVDGQSALEPGLDVERYPLLAQLWVGGVPELAQALAAEVDVRGLALNRRPEHLTVLAMTGVTALTRHVALEIEARGDDAWPARRVAGLLAAADLTHVSNEVSFMPGCPPQSETTSFCARPEYMATLSLIGADVVELTGNHNLDYGPDYALSSLELYRQAGMGVFGGGADAVQARRPLLIEQHGNRLAFLGYNAFGPGYAWATADGPGAARFSLDAVRADVAAARPLADVIIATVQYTECYTTEPLPGQLADLRAMAEAGADVVIGSQAHQPQALEFLGRRAIFYGLGNLFFDQSWSDATRSSLIVRHLIYEGRLIAVELIPTVIDDNWQPHVAEGEEREAILREVLGASAGLPPWP